ncbi:hypothetical protein FB451DRAFT_1419629 [Mycena latifolia]|nr:hypothetical protein FB451DRAFT_1419629 [Mycena latifolia]
MATSALSARPNSNNNNVPLALLPSSPDLAASALPYASDEDAATMPPSSPAPAALSALPNASDEDAATRGETRPLSPEDNVVNISDFSTPPSSPRAAAATLQRKVRLPHAPPPPRIRAKRAAARLEGAATQAEAAARMYAMMRGVEAAARRIGEWAKGVFWLVHQTDEAICLIGQEAEGITKLLADAGAPSEEAICIHLEAVHEGARLAAEQFANWVAGDGEVATCHRLAFARRLLRAQSLFLSLPRSPPVSFVPRPPIPLFSSLMLGSLWVSLFQTLSGSCVRVRPSPRLISDPGFPAALRSPVGWDGHSPRTPTHTIHLSSPLSIDSV